jgi:hypothetical protein
MSLKLITQANLTDCGLACVAMVSGKSLETVLRAAIKECGYPKEGPHTTSDEDLFKLLDHFGIKYGKKQKVKTVDALPSIAIMETRKMPSTGNSHLVVFERTADGEARALDPGWWLKQQIRSDWNRIKLDTFIPILTGNESTSKKGSKTTKASASVASADESQGEVAEAVKPAKASKPNKPATKTAEKTAKPAKQKSPLTTEDTTAPAASTSLADEWSDGGSPTSTNDTAVDEGRGDAA